MGRFRRWINDMAVTELPLHGRKFTWTSSFSSASPTLVKLDRVFCSLDWEEIFPDCLLQSSASDDSDHCPLILGLRDNIIRNDSILNPFGPPWMDSRKRLLLRGILFNHILAQCTLCP
jgi:hypothetical protein